MISYDEFNDLQLDVMREIGNIGAGNACTALSVLMGTPIDMSVPSVRLIKYDDVKNSLNTDDIVLGIKVKVTDDLDGMMIHIVSKAFAEKIINTFYEKKLDSLDMLDEMDASVLNEMANITSGAYANSLATLTNMTVNIGTPDRVLGSIESIMVIPLEEFTTPGQQLLIIDEEFIINENHITSNMILALEQDSLKKLFEKLGVQI